MPDSVLNDLARRYDRLARTTPTWASAPAIARLVPAGSTSVLNDLVDAIRRDAPDSRSSDRVVRELARSGIDEPDALLVLLHGLVPGLRRTMHYSASAEHISDTLGDLVFVIVDAVDNGEVDQLTHLASRFVNRAQTRAYKRVRRQVPTPCPPELIEASTDMTAVDVADHVAVRADLSRFAASISEAVAAGQVSSHGWSTYVNLRLARSVTGRPARAGVAARNAASRAARRIQPYAEAHLLCHAS